MEPKNDQRPTNPDPIAGSKAGRLSHSVCILNCSAPARERMMQLCSAMQGEGACEQVQEQVLGQVSNSISLRMDSASPSRAAPTLAPFRAAATGRLEHGQACLPDLIWSFPGVDHFRPDRSSTAIQLHLTSQQSTGQPANQPTSSSAQTNIPTG